MSNNIENAIEANKMIRPLIAANVPAGVKMTEVGVIIGKKLSELSDGRYVQWASIAQDVDRPWDERKKVILDLFAYIESGQLAKDLGSKQSDEDSDGEDGATATTPSGLPASKNEPEPERSSQPKPATAPKEVEKEAKASDDEVETLSPVAIALARAIDKALPSVKPSVGVDLKPILEQVSNLESSTKQLDERLKKMEIAFEALKSAFSIGGKQ